MPSAHKHPAPASPPSGRQQGLSLVELLVALVLGLVLVGGVLGIYLSSRASFRTNESLARMQENARFVFELLGREVREAGLVPCGTPLTANLLRSTTTPGLPWWVDTDAGMIRGYDDTQPSPGLAGASAPRAADTDALVLLRPASDEGTVGRVQQHDPSGKQFTLASVAGFQALDVVLVCDLRSSALLQIASVNAPTKQLAYDTSGLNCTTDLSSVGVQCASPTPKTFDAGSVIVKWEPVFWYVATNDTGSRSLYRVRTVKPSGGAGAWINRPEEVARDVHDLQIDYLTRDRSNGGQLATGWVSASSFTGGWDQQATEVAAIRFTLTLRSPLPSGTGGQFLQRTLVGVVALRNREY